MIARWRHFTLLLAAWASTVVVAHAQPVEPAAEPGPLAILIRNPDPDDGAPPYALADQYGRVQRLVEDSPRVALGGYVGQRVRIRHDTGRTLLASQLELPRVANEPAPLREVSPAQFIPPSRAKRIDRAVRGAQATDDLPELPETFDDALGLDAPAESIPGPAPDAPTPALGPADTGPIDLDNLPPPADPPAARIEPVPAEPDYHAEALPIIEPIRRRPHDPDCPHCREKLAKVAPNTDLCRTCGRSPGWCGPTCNPASRRGLYGRLDYLLWWFSGMNTPPLATTNDLGNAPILGQPGTRVVFGGNNDLLDDARNGVRFTIGAWLDDQRDFAIEADWMLFENETAGFAFNNQAGTVAFGRPFYNVAPVDANTLVVGPPQEDVQIISLPGQAGGALRINARSEFESFGLRLRTGICCREIGGSCNTCGCDSCQSGRVGRSGRPRAISRIDFVGGYRYTRLDEQLGFNENSTILSTANPNVGNRIDVRESFSTENDFHGVDLGFVYDYRAQRWGLELISRIAIGGTRQRVAINGSNTISAPGTPGITTEGGLLAQASNIGVYRRDRFSVLPELSARLSYRVTQQLSLSAGYSLLYWANVVRPGDQIDFSVDGRLASGALVAPTANSHPRFAFNETSLWAHGFNFGLDYQY